MDRRDVVSTSRPRSSSNRLCRVRKSFLSRFPNKDIILHLSRTGPKNRLKVNQKQVVNRPADQGPKHHVGNNLFPVVVRASNDGDEVARKILNKPPMALRRTKEFFKALSTNRAGDITYADAHLGLACLGSEDMREAVTAFREKREGKFQNR